MKAEELRIGNFILDNEAEATKTIYWRVEQINQYRIGDKRIGVLFRGGSCWTVMDCIEPIPLTEEWLEKFKIKEGIKIDDGEIGVYWGSNPHDYRFIDKDLSPEKYKCNVYIYSGLGSYSDYAAVIQCNYVHTLQNLYFSLTGTELELKK
tara:strand:+ start:508 stop:957 length:450 start_codon:yes stop_codon:yes gene_type:complete